MFFKKRKGGQRERILITYGTYSVYMYVYIIGLIVRLYDTFGVGAFFKVISQRITRLKILERVYVFKFMLLIMADCGAAGKQIKLHVLGFFSHTSIPKELQALSNQNRIVAAFRYGCTRILVEKRFSVFALPQLKTTLCNL